MRKNHNTTGLCLLKWRREQIMISAQALGINSDELALLVCKLTMLIKELEQRQDKARQDKK
ncbi:hypothetical protein VN1000_02720 [Helicobacter pylori]